MAFTYGWCSAGSENRNEGNTQRDLTFEAELI